MAIGRCATALVLSLLFGDITRSSAQSVPLTAPSQAPTTSSRTLASALERPTGPPIHILYLHGIGAQEDNDSLVLRQKICATLKIKNCGITGGVKKSREFADEGPFSDTTPPPAWTYLGKSIWQSPVYTPDQNRTAWQKSRPFVDHWVITRDHGPSILVDEINYWPLMFLLKCRNIMANESLLAGRDVTDINYCAGIRPKGDKLQGTFDYYPFISQAQAASLIAEPLNGVLLNRYLKNVTLDWGFADALSAVGPLRDLLLEAVRQLLVKSVKYSGEDATALNSKGRSSDNPQYVFVSHSLGSYLVFNALNSSGADASLDSDAKEHRESYFNYILQQTDKVFFLANQVPLLELAALNTAPASTTSNSGLFSKWVTFHTGTPDKPMEAPQLVAWSDPSDLLSWWVPDICGVNVYNATIKNGTHILGLFELPTSAHDNYKKQTRVVDSILNKPLPKPTRPSNDAIPTAPCPVTTQTP